MNPDNPNYSDPEYRWAESPADDDSERCNQGDRDLDAQVQRELDDEGE